MNINLSYSEYSDSQLPAIIFLKQLGYQFIAPDKALEERKGLFSHVILEGILEDQLRKINSFEYKGEVFKFSDGNIHNAIMALKNLPDEGLVKTNERAYDLLTLGKSFEENIQGDRKSFTLRYIDWNNIENNVFHVTEEFEVQGLNTPRRPDLVLFVNGIPFVVIENKRRDEQYSIDQAISQHIRNQKKDEGIPQLFHYTQLLLAIHPNEVKYATTGTARKFWSVWKEKADVESEAKNILETAKEQRLPTEQDKILYCLCRPERLMEHTYKHIVFDAGERKITRYQQYFAIKNTLERIKEFTTEGHRKGGVIWHTQGSGKSLTMVMLSKVITLDKEIPNSRLIIVTDRTDLDDQIWKTFNYCGKEAIKAKTGAHLIELVENKGVEIITTVIDKFDSALNKKDFYNDSGNIFVLVDESHRSQYGFTHTKMKRVLPNACYLGFTGTPLMKKEKSTAAKFGGIIDKYTIDQAVKDKAVLPLLYEGRQAILNVWKEQIDKGFERQMENMVKEQQAIYKKRFATEDQLLRSLQVIEEIAHNISEHWIKNWQGSEFKAQIAAPDKLSAVRYLNYFERQGKINTALLISPPDTREDNDDVYEDLSENEKQEIQNFWAKMMRKYRSKEAYEETLINQFKSPDDDVEIIIVVSKLLTGFDAPRNTVLYLTKKLTEHNLLQAIARVNRLFEGKDFGFIIDYRGILGQLNEALTKYNAFEEFEEEDVAGTLTNVLDEIEKLSQRYTNVWDIFKEVGNKNDKEALERHLRDEELRNRFYENLSAFAINLQVALSTEKFYDITPQATIDKYISELKFFQSLRKTVQQRYAETIDYKEYESRVRKLMDTYVGTEGVKQITEQVNIFEKEAFEAEVEKSTGSIASKADIIAYRTKRTIHEKMDEDPVMYKKFSELIILAIENFNNKRISETEYLKQVIDIKDQVVTQRFMGIPDILSNKPHARALYNVLKEILKEKKQIPDNELAIAGIEMESIIEKKMIRDWKRNNDVQKQMLNDMEDFLLAFKGQHDIDIPFDDIDKIMDWSLQIAKNNF